MDSEEKKKVSAEPLEVTATETAPPPAPKPSGGRSNKPRKKGTRDSGEKGGGGKKKKGSREPGTPREKQPAEDVLMDPRIRETRSWLAWGCSLDKERIEADKKIEEEIKQKGQERARKRGSSDSSSHEHLMEEKEELKKAKKKKKKDEEVKEEYHNETKTQDSPNAKSPEASSAMLEEMDFELRVTEVTHVKKLSVTKLASVLMSNFFRLPIFLVITKYYVIYGVSFIGVCALMMLFVGVPTVFLELTMGQFSSLPPNTFFARMAPIAQGVGFSMLLLRFIGITCIHVDVRYLFLFFQHLTFVSNERDDRCAQAGMPFCHTESMCPPGQEIGMYGSCITPLANHDVAFKDRILGRVMQIRAVQSSPTQLLIDNELAETNGYTMFTFFLLILVAGAPLIDGAEMFATIAPWLVFSSFLTPLVILITLDMSQSDFSRFRAGWNGDMDGFSDPYAWIVSFCLVFCMFNVGEGTWMFIGSWLGFRHKQTMKSLWITVGLQLLLMFFMSFVFCAWAVVVVEYQHNGYLEHEEILKILADRPLQFWLRLPTTMLPDRHGSYMFMAYLFFTVNSLGCMMTHGEYLLVSMLRAFPFLVRVNKVQLRACALLFISSSTMLVSTLLYDLHVFTNSELYYIYITMMLVVIFYEMTIFIYIYGLQRILVNMKGVYRYNTPAVITFSRCTPYLKFIYRYILSWLLMLGIAYATNFYVCNRFSLINVINMTCLLLPWIVGLYKIGRHAQTTNPVVTLFRNDPRFGPAAVSDRKMAATEENKMGSVGLQ